MRKKAFTLIELLVVIAIIAMLLSIVTPALKRAKEAGRRVVCMTNMKGLTTGVAAYAMQYNDSIPSSVGGANGYWNNYIVQGYNRIGNAAPHNTEREGWYNLGRLWGTTIINDPAVFYCPSQKDPSLQEKANFPINLPPLPFGKAVPTCYMYGLFGQVGPSNAPLAPELVTKTLKMSKLKQKALISDVFMPIGSGVAKQKIWSHEQGKLGLSAGYGDCHVSFVEVEPVVKEIAGKQDEGRVHIGDLYAATMFELLAGNPSVMLEKYRSIIDVGP